MLDGGRPVPRVYPPQEDGIDTHPPAGVDSVQHQTPGVNIDLRYPPPLAVEDLKLLVVDPGGDLIAGCKAGLPDLDLLGAELGFGTHPLPRHLVQLPHLGVSLRDHLRVLALAVAQPPVGDHRLASRQRVVCDRHPLGALVDRDRLAP